MDGHFDDAAIVIAAHAEEFGHPVEAVGSRRGNGTAEGVTLAGERLDVLVPDAKSSGGVDVGLGWLVDPGESGSI